MGLLESASNGKMGFPSLFIRDESIVGNRIGSIPSMDSGYRVSYSKKGNTWKRCALEWKLDHLALPSLDW